MNNISTQLRPSSGWVYVYIFIICVLIISIPVTLIPSLIPIFLPERNYPAGTIVDDHTGFTTMNVSFAALSTITQISDVNFDLNSLASQLEDKLATPKGNLAVLGTTTHNVITQNGKRRRREILCDLSLSKNSSHGFVFRLRMRYPSKYACRTLECVKTFFIQIRKKFLELKNILVTTSDGTKIELCVCSADDADIIDTTATVISSTTTVESTTRTTQGSILINTTITNNINQTAIPTAVTTNSNTSTYSTVILATITSTFTSISLPPTVTETIITSTVTTTYIDTILTTETVPIVGTTTTAEPTATVEPATLEPTTTEAVISAEITTTTIEPTTLEATTTEPTTTLETTTLETTTLEPTTSAETTTLEITTLEMTILEITTLEPTTSVETTAPETTTLELITTTT